MRDAGPPSGPIRIELAWQVQRAWRPICGEPVSLHVEDGRWTIGVDGVDQHDVIVLEMTNHDGNALPMSQPTTSAVSMSPLRVVRFDPT